jgi:hypothetical protein
MTDADGQTAEGVDAGPRRQADDHHTATVGGDRYAAARARLRQSPGRWGMTAAEPAHLRPRGKRHPVGVSDLTTLLDWVSYLGRRANEGDSIVVVGRPNGISDGDIVTFVPTPRVNPR